MYPRVPTELFGPKTQFAELSMDGRDSIIVTFAQSDNDLKCMDKHRQKTGSYEQPANCIINKNTIGHFNQALLDAGWVLTRTKGGYYNYVHPRVGQLATKSPGEELSSRRCHPHPCVAPFFTSSVPIAIYSDQVRPSSSSSQFDPNHSSSNWPSND